MTPTSVRSNGQIVKHFLETPPYELKNEKYFAALRLKMETIYMK